VTEAVSRAPHSATRTLDTTEIVSDGGGIAIDPVCGQPPIRFDEFFGEEIK
jgi:hypothetical protein